MLKGQRLVWSIALLVLTALIIFTCGDDNTTTGSTNRSPNKPEINIPSGAPPNQSTNKSITSTLSWICSDPDGDALIYDVHFGTSSTPPLVSSSQSGTSYSPGTLNYSTKYYWRIVAKDPNGASTSSDIWDFTTQSQPQETISTPSTPTGPSSGETGQSLTYSTGGSTSNLGHSVEYRFDWGDGSYSGWTSSTSASHSWSSAGTYSVKAQARCATHTGIVSSWSNSKIVTICDADFFYVSGDATVCQLTPNQNFGDDDYLGFGASAGYNYRGYVRFNLSAIPCGSTIKNAILRLFVFDRGSGYAIIARSIGSWSESSITWNNQPGGELQPYATSTPPSAGYWWEIDVKSIVQKWITDCASNYGFNIEGTGNVIIVYSSESDYPPELYIDYCP